MSSPQAASEHTFVVTAYADAFRQALADLGVDVGALQRLTSVAVDAERPGFWGNGTGAEAVQHGAAWLAQQTGDPRIGLKLGLRMPGGADGIVEQLVRSAQTLRDALQVHARFAPLLFDFMHWQPLEETSLLWLRLLPTSGLTPDPVIVDYRLVRMQRMIASLLADPSLVPDEVHLPFARPPHSAPYREVFGRAVLRFSQPRAALRYDTGLLSRSLVQSDADLHQQLLPLGARLLNALERPRTVADKLEAVIFRGLQERRTSLANSARALHMSERTLRRRLALEGTSYSELLDRVRATLATMQLQGKASTSVVAERVGFESASALRRASKRWSARPG